MKNLILTLICCLTLQFGVNAQTQLQTGDLVLLEVNERAQFTFMPLVDLEAGTTLYFTDQAVDNSITEAFSRTDDSYETVIRYQTTASVGAGTIIRFEGLNSRFTIWGGSVIPYREITNGINISSEGDQLTVFQDSNPTNAISPDAEPRFLFAINLASTEKNSICSATNDNETRKPLGLFPVTYNAGEGPGTFLALGNGNRCDDDSEYAIYNAAVYGTSFSSMRQAYEVMTDPDHWIIIQTASAPTPAYLNSLNVLLSGSAVLPVIMTHFSAKENQGAVNLGWKTSQELNSAFFAIEHSINGVDYEEIGQLAASGQSSIVRKYLYVDETPAKGNNYYRLRQVDLDGSFVYSEVKIVTIAKAFSTTNIFPNPAFNVVNIKGLTQKEDTTIRIFDNKGATIMERVANGDSDLETFDVSNLAKGFYFIQIISETETVTDKFIKF